MATLLPVDPEPVGESEPAPTEIDGLKWHQLRQLGAALYPTSSPYGKPTVFHCTARFIIIGTYSAEILLFNYSQQLVAHLPTRNMVQKSENETMLGPVTSINMDSDETYLIAGFALGWVGVFDLEAPPHQKPKLVTAIPPLATEDIPRGNSIIQRHETHVRGTPISHCCFVSRPVKGKCKFWSLDTSGLLITHEYKRLMLEKVSLSKRLLGSYSKQVIILDSDSHYEWRLLALLTEDMLLLIDTKGNSVEDLDESELSDLQQTKPGLVVLSIPRNKDTSVDPNGRGCVRFNKQSRQLIYSWGNQLKQLEFNKSNQFTVLSAYTHNAPIKYMDWIGEKLVVLVTQNNISLVELGNQLVIDADSPNISPASKCLQMEVLEHSIFVLGKHEISIGQFTNWADRLFGLLNAEKPVDAVELALHYYRDDGELAVLGLPNEKEKKDKAIAAALPDLIMTALQYGLEFEPQSLQRLLPEAVKACIAADLPLLEPLMDMIENNGAALDAYFSALLQAVNQRLIYELPPAVFRAIVAKHPEPKLFYNLSLATLDLDLAFKMCALYPKALQDVKIYLENQALRDYVSPIQNSEGGINSRCYNYLSMIFTSRIYPTGDDMDSSQSLDAKTQVYEALFIGESHDLLIELLQDNPTVFFDTLSLGFQDPWFNDENAEINRQIIVNVLLSISKEMSVPLATFLARNYPKYHQYIVLQGAVLDQIVKTLCSYRPISNENESDPDTTEEQLALLSLLSLYKPRDNSQFIQQLTEAHYLLVLEHVLRKQNKLLDLATVQLKLNSKDAFGIIAETLIKSPKEATLFVSNNIDKLLEVDPRNLGKLVARFNLKDVWKTSMSNFDCLDAAYSELYKRGGELPGATTNTEYLAELSKLQDHERATWALEFIFTRESDIILPLIVDTLIEYHRLDILSILLQRKDRDAEALIYIVNYLPEIRENPEELHTYVNIACSLCQRVALEDRAGGIKMRERLLEALLELDGVDKELERVIDMLSECDISDMVQIVGYLLDFATKQDNIDKKLDEKAKRTRKYQSRLEVINELHIHILQRERALRCFLSLIQADGYQDLLSLMKGRAQGWIVPVNGECEVCGGKIVGLGVDAEHLYSSWERSYKRYIAGESEPLFKNNDTPKVSEPSGDTLVLFQCGHSYHCSCLRNMSPQRQCIVCSDK